MKKIKKKRVKTCECGSGEKYSYCCMRYHRGEPADVPGFLVQARFCAYKRGLMDYIIDTTDPEGPRWQEDRDAWKEDLAGFDGEVLHSLTIEEVIDDEPKDGATVVFTYGYEKGRISETSTFRFEDGWKYVDSVLE